MFKPKTNASKNTNYRKSQRKHIKRQNRIILYSVFSFICLTTIITISIFINQKQPNSQLSTQKKFFLKEQIDKNNKPLLLFTAFKDFIEYLNSKLYKSSDIAFKQNLILFATKTDPNVLPKAHQVYYLTLAIEINNLSNFIVLNKNTEQILPTIYRTKLFILLKLLTITFDAIDMLGFKYNEDNKEANKYINLKFIYQQFHTYNTLKALISIFETDKNAILSELGLLFNNKMSVKILMKIEKVMDNLNGKMFVETNETFKLNNETEVKTDYIINSPIVYKRFLLLNIYLILSHIFEVNEEFEVINIRKEFLQEINDRILQGGVKDDESILENYRKGLVDNCLNIFKDIDNFKNNTDYHLIANFIDLNKNCIRSRILNS